MNKLLIASAFASISLFAGSAEAACRQVYGGTSCNWMGQCWHNPPKTVCDAPRIAAPPPQARINVQPNVGGGRIITHDGASFRGGRVISTDGAGILSQNGTNFRR
jgi:hypothetical protein